MKGAAAVTIVLPAGGRGERLAELAGAAGRNKAAVRVGRTSLIGRTFGMYERAGMCRAVALVFHRPGSVLRALAPAIRRGVSVAISRDPGRPVGKGGAIRLALDRGLIPADRPFIVHNPDDQIVGIDRTFVGRVLVKHRACARRGALATAVCVPGTRYAYSAFTLRRDGLARGAVMYPFVPYVTHIGVTIFEPGAIPLFRKLIPRGRRVDFESVILPALARRGKLAIAYVPAGSWIPVNDLKSYRELLAALGG